MGVCCLCCPGGCLIRTSLAPLRAWSPARSRCAPGRRVDPPPAVLRASRVRLRPLLHPPLQAWATWRSARWCGPSGSIVTSPCCRLARFPGTLGVVSHGPGRAPRRKPHEALGCASGPYGYWGLRRRLPTSPMRPPRPSRPRRRSCTPRRSWNPSAAAWGRPPFLAFLMSICDKAHAATQYALLSALFAPVGLVGRHVSGWAVERLRLHRLLRPDVLARLAGLFSPPLGPSLDVAPPTAALHRSTPRRLSGGVAFREGTSRQRYPFANVRQSEQMLPPAEEPLESRRGPRRRPRTASSPPSATPCPWRWTAAG